MTVLFSVARWVTYQMRELVSPLLAPRGGQAVIVYSEPGGSVPLQQRSLTEARRKLPVEVGRPGSKQQRTAT